MARRNTVITHKSYLRHKPASDRSRRGATRRFQLEPQVIYLGSRARIIIQTLASGARFHNPLTFSANWVAGNYTLLYLRSTICVGETPSFSPVNANRRWNQYAGGTFAREISFGRTWRSCIATSFFVFGGREPSGRENQRGEKEKRRSKAINPVTSERSFVEISSTVFHQMLANRCTYTYLVIHAIYTLQLLFSVHRDSSICLLRFYDI